MRIITQDKKNDIPYDYSVVYTVTNLGENRTYIKSDTPIGSYTIGSYRGEDTAKKELENMHNEYMNGAMIYYARKNEDV